jgi:flagellar biosynthesis/type III secretory pathway chaperone
MDSMESKSKEIRLALESLLENEADCARALLQSLKAESAALASRDTKLVTINSANKRKLVEKLQQASDARITYMESHGLTASAEEIRGYNPVESPNAKLDALFIELSQLAQQCFEENRIIGQLINRRTQFIGQILRSLSPTANLNGLTYEENGSAATGQQSSMFYLTKI